MSSIVVWNVVWSAALAIIVFALGRVPAWQRRPALMHLLWFGVLLRLVIPAVIAVPILPDTTATVRIEANFTNAVPSDVSVQLVPLETVPTPAETFTPVDPPAASWTDSWSLSSVLISLSLLGTAALLVHSTVRCLRLRRIQSQSHAGPQLLVELLARLAGEMKLTCVPRLRIVHGLASPSIWGFGPRVTLLVPQHLVDSFDEDQWSCILTHELAHVIRGDLWFNLAAAGVLHLFWWNPIAWWSFREMRACQETSCDAITLARNSSSRRQYAETLLQVADSWSRPTLTQPQVLLGFGTRSLLTRRFEMIADASVRTRATLAASLCLCAFALTFICLPVRAEKKVSAASVDVKNEIDDKSDKLDESIQITVLGPNERPLAGAKIHASIWTKEPFQANRDYICDENGNVSIAIPKTMDILRLWARKDGHVSLFANWSPQHEAKPREFPREFTFRLEQGTVIGGVIKNEDGEPIRGARVSVKLVNPQGETGLDEHPIPNIWLAELGGSKTTDDQGRWTLDNAPAGEEFGFELMLNHPDYISDYTWGGLQKEQNVVSKSLRDGTGTIVMHRGTKLSGVVTNAEGKVVPDAVVIWGDDPYFQKGSQEVRTDAAGRYQFPPLPEGNLPVTVVAEGWSPEQQRVNLTGNNFSANFHLKKGKRLRIQFEDDAGASIPGVAVGIDGWRGGKSLYNHKHSNVLDSRIPHVADQDGVFDWTWAPNDEVTLQVYKDGYNFFTLPGEDLKLTAEEKSEFVLTMSKVAQKSAATEASSAKAAKVAAESSSQTEMEARLVGTWKWNSFLTQGEVTYQKDGTYRYEYVNDSQESQKGTWRVEGLTEIVYTPEKTDLKESRWRIVSVTENELKLQPLSSGTSNKTVTYTRAETEASETQAAPQPKKPTASAESKKAAAEPAQVILKYDDGKPDGKKSIAGTGQMIQFIVPDKNLKLKSLRLHCARYGTSKAPNEDVDISLVSDDEQTVFHTEMVPYSRFKRGESRWTTIEFQEPVEVPEKFWVIVDFNAEQTKGVYLSYDTSTGGKHSKTGVPGGESNPVTTGGDWMIQAVLTTK